MTILKENYGKFADKNYNRKVDRRVAKAMLKAYRDAVPEGERLAIFDLIDKKFNVIRESTRGWFFSLSAFINAPVGGTCENSTAMAIPSSNW